MKLCGVQGTHASWLWIKGGHPGERQKLQRMNIPWMGACAMRRYRSARWLPHRILYTSPCEHTREKGVQSDCMRTIPEVVAGRFLFTPPSHRRAKLTEGTPPPYFLSPSSCSAEEKDRGEAFVIVVAARCARGWKRGLAKWRRWERRGWERFRVRDRGGDKGARRSLVSGRRKNCRDYRPLLRLQIFFHSRSTVLSYYLPPTPFPHAIVPHIFPIFSSFTSINYRRGDSGSDSFVTNEQRSMGGEREERWSGRTRWRIRIKGCARITAMRRERERLLPFPSFSIRWFRSCPLP